MASYFTRLEIEEFMRLNQSKERMIFMDRVADYFISAAVIATVVWVVFLVYGKLKGENV